MLKSSRNLAALAHIKTRKYPPLVWRIIVIVIALSNSGCTLLFAAYRPGYSPYKTVCDNSAFALAVGNGDFELVQQQITTINLNKPYIGNEHLVSTDNKLIRPQIGFYGCTQEITYLDIALHSRNLKMVELLLKHGADPNLEFIGKRNSYPYKQYHPPAIFPHYLDGQYGFPDTNNPGSTFNLEAIKLMATYKRLKKNYSHDLASYQNSGRYDLPIHTGERRIAFHNLSRIDELRTIHFENDVFSEYLSRGLIEEAKLLVELGIDLSPNKDFKSSSLHLAISKIPEQEKALELVKLMAAHGAKVGDPKELPPVLLEVAKQKKPSASQIREILILALQEEGDMSYLKGPLIESLLYAQDYCVDCIQLLSAKGVDFSDGYLVFLAKNYRTGRNIEAILDSIKLAGGDIHLFARKAGISPLDTVIPCASCIGWFANNGISPNQSYSKDYPPIRTAFNYCDKELLELFARLGADINVKSRTGTPILFEAIRFATSLRRDRNGRLQNRVALDFLLENKVDVFATDSQQNTSLHIAVQEKNIELIRYLMKRGLKVDQKNQNGRTPLMIAFDLNDGAIQEVLREKVSFTPPRQLQNSRTKGIKTKN